MPSDGINVKVVPGRNAGVVFFFQAEDGIRDLTVTGVQTCALPILLLAIAARGDRELMRAVARLVPAAALATVMLVAAGLVQGWERLALWCAALPIQIGRASCRERV